MKIILYNTLSRSKEEFIPIDPAKKQAKIYSCGPTVYSSPHIGNFRAFMLADLLRNTLHYIGGYDVIHVMNITDVGHLTDDGDQGEDKMEKGAKKEGLTVWEIARKYENEFHNALTAFSIKPFDVMPRATAYMQEQINMVKMLTTKGYTYVIPGDGIYMDTSTVSDYGKLAHLDVEGLCSHHRKEGADIDSSKKRQITDFALRKFSSIEKQRAMEWIFEDSHKGALIVEKESPKERNDDVVQREGLTEAEKKTKGFPGWHIECSAMSVNILGKKFDIHTGGVDHIPVHHTNEIVQTECALGVNKWVNYRMHQQFLNVDGGKMSKSKGHNLSVKAILEKGYEPLDVRYFYLTAHYRSFLDFSREALDVAAKTRKNLIKKLYNKVGSLDFLLNLDERNTGGVLYQKLCEIMANDLNTVEVLSLMHQSLHIPTHEDIEDILLFDMQITKLGLLKGMKRMFSEKDTKIPESIKNLAEKRLVAKQEKDWTASDWLRDQIKNLGREIKDVTGGYELTKIENFVKETSR